MCGLESELGILLIALGREAHVIKLDLVHARARHQAGQSEVILLRLGIRGIDPRQLPVLPPRLAGAPRVHRELGMVLGLVGVAEQGDARDGVQAERM